jgi:hypothetical protein
MTMVEIVFRYATPPTETVTRALANTREVYGIRRLHFDPSARTLRVEYDVTRLNAAAVTKLVRQAGLEIDPETVESQVAIPPPSAPKQAPAA